MRAASSADTPPWDRHDDFSDEWVASGGARREDTEGLPEEEPGAFAALETSTPAEELASDSLLALYLREINSRRLLTRNEEIELAKQREAGEEAKEKLATGTVAPVERDHLEEAVRIGDAARKCLVESNLRLVVSVAKNYRGRGLPLLDLIQEGNVGVQRAVKKYDWRRGFRFSTYAYHWIRQAVTRAVADHGRTIRLPEHVIDHLTVLYRTRRELEQEYGREPTVAEIGERLGLDPRKVRDAFRAARVPLSLDMPVREDEEATLAGAIADGAARGPSEEAEEAVLSHMVDEALRRHLTPREAHILRMRFGFQDGQVHTLGEAGKEFGISRERARQVEANAISRLRTSVRFMEQFRDHVP